MAKTKNKIVIKNRKKFVSGIIKLVAVIALIVVCVIFVKNLSSNSVKKQIEKLEGQKVKMIGQEIVAYIGENEFTQTDLNTKDVISFKVEYTYMLTEGPYLVTKYYTTSDGISIKISDTALAGLTSDKTGVQIQEGISEDKTVTFTVSYDKNKDITKDFTYTIKSDATVPDDSSTTNE